MFFSSVLGVLACIALFCQSAGAFPAADSAAAADSMQQLQRKAVKIFVDCPQYDSNCDLDFFRTELSFVNFVRDRDEAQVDILISTQSTGSGGTEYTLSFIGQKDFKSVNDTLAFASQSSDTKETVRQNMLRFMKLGLIRYAERSPLADKIGIEYSMPTAPGRVADAWNYWVFSISGNGYVSGQQSYVSKYFYSSLSANRVTPGRKLSLSFYQNYSDNWFQVDDTTEILSVSRGKGFSDQVTFALGDHWSWQISNDISTSTYSNKDFSFSVSPAIEYSIFPYSESTRRLYRLDYRLSYFNEKYHEITLYGKTSENLAAEGLTAAIDFTEPWGSASISLYGSHFFHDFRKYDLNLYMSTRIRLFEGLSISISGNLEKVHDQLSLPAGDASQEDILLQQRELETGYRYWTNFGLSYSFGSIFNNVVNPRFGSN